MHHMGLLDGKVALITGSTRGIGKAMAETFARQGARVVVNGRREEDARSVAADLPGAVAIGADMSDLPSVQAAVTRIVAELGQIDVLVNNAGISTISAITRLTDEDWDRVLRVNLTGPMYVTRAVVPVMKAQNRGVIINVVSGAGISGTIGYSAYSASKGGLVGLTMTLALELARFGIRVNALSPSAMTDMLRQNPPDVLATISANVPTADAVSDAAVFLASDLSSTVTGQVLAATAKFDPPTS
jgi:3-oxoacyl-[acyl-carrier protein] reductase